MEWSSEELLGLLKDLDKKEPKPESEQERFFKDLGIKENLEHRVSAELVYYYYLRWKVDTEDLKIIKRLTFFKVKHGFPQWVKRSNWSKTTMLMLDKSSFPITPEVLEEMALIKAKENRSRINRRYALKIKEKAKNTPA